MGLKLTSSTAAILLLLVTISVGVKAADPELTTDFNADPTQIDASFFTSTILRDESVNNNGFATVKPVNSQNFTGLTGLGVSNAKVIFPPGTVNRPHIHPRGTETLFIIEGTLFVGLVDSGNRLFTQTLLKGDIFVFPRALVHFQINWDPKVTVQAYAAFSSSNPGTTVLPTNIFGSGIDPHILAQSFGVSVDVIKALVAAQPPPPK